MSRINKHLQRALNVALFVLTVAILTACTDNRRMAKLLGGVPADSEIVAVVNVKQIVESAGGTVSADGVITLPQGIDSIIDKPTATEISKLSQIISEGAMDTEAVAIFNTKDCKGPIVLARTNDREKFVAMLAAQGFKEKESNKKATLYRRQEEYGNRASFVALRDDAAYLIADVAGEEEASKSITAIRNAIDNSDSNPISKTPRGKYLLTENALGLSINMSDAVRKSTGLSDLPAELTPLMDGSLNFRTTLSDNRLAMNYVWLDKEGKEADAKSLKKFFDADAKIDKKALALLPDSVQLIGACALKDVNWTSYLEAVAATTGMTRSQRAQLALVSGYLANVDGTAAFGVGLPGGIKSLRNKEIGTNTYADLAVGLVIGTKPGKASEIVTQLSAMAASVGLTPEKEDNIDVYPIPGADVKVRVGAVGDYMVLSTRKISESGRAADAAELNFSDYLSALTLTLLPGDSLTQDLGLDGTVRVAAVSDSGRLGGELTVEIDNNSKVGILGRILNAVTTAQQKLK